MKTQVKVDWCSFPPLFFHLSGSLAVLKVKQPMVRRVQREERKNFTPLWHPQAVFSQTFEALDK